MCVHAAKLNIQILADNCLYFLKGAAFILGDLLFSLLEVIFQFIKEINLTVTYSALQIHNSRRLSSGSILKNINLTISVLTETRVLLGRLIIQ